jgi:hypothetical protein
VQLLKRFFWVLASFRLSHRPPRAGSFVKASPKHQKSSLHEYGRHGYSISSNAPASQRAVQVNFEIGIATDLTASKNLSLEVYFDDNYNSEPAPGRQSNDSKLVGAVDYKF